jgi:hypothetical protein
MISAILTEIGYSQYIFNFEVKKRTTIYSARLIFSRWDQPVEYCTFLLVMRWVCFGKNLGPYNLNWLVDIVIGKANTHFSGMLNSGTKSNKNIGWKKCIFAMANLQNDKQVKIRVDDMISQQFFRLQNLCYVYNIWKNGDARYLVFIVDICNCGSSAICWRYQRF